MKKYLLTISNTLQTYFIYRFNFIMWRVRTVIRLLAMYFLWLAIFRNQMTIGDYNQQLILTYILGTSFIWAITMASRSVDVSAEIATGDLINYLLKPLNYFRYWFFRDLADKLLNVSFVIAEMAIILWLLKPPFFWQTNPVYLISFFLTLIMGMMIYFLLSFIISSTTFWYVTHAGWPARFLFEALLGFIAGGLFPLDLLPAPIFTVFRALPSTYLLFFPLQVYLGRVAIGQILVGIAVMIFWIVSLNFLLHFIWERGLRIYEAYGR